MRLKNRFDDLENLNRGVIVAEQILVALGWVAIVHTTVYWDNVDVNCNGTIYEEILA